MSWTPEQVRKQQELDELLESRILNHEITPDQAEWLGLSPYRLDAMRAWWEMEQREE
jgi:hypothetical protein